ncbi:hypothetical protein P1P68_01940 [Streptomyces scabiei]|nr:hypothetical protein [Streptomyces scabiei]MDW8803600.1 hypothetical protein [Streptomyces scabiei]
MKHRRPHSTSDPVHELPVDPQWFTTTTLADDITLIQEPHVHPFLQANT